MGHGSFRIRLAGIVKFNTGERAALFVPFPQPHLLCPITHRYKTRPFPSPLCDKEQLLHSQSIEETFAHSLKSPQRQKPLRQEPAARS